MSGNCKIVEPSELESHLAMFVKTPRWLLCRSRWQYMLFIVFEKN
jgi:hypothetical protein